MNKVKIIATTKDEAAYIPEWIFHNLYFGVDAIDMYINRTTDNSIEILKKIQKHYPQIRFFSTDWVDLLPPNLRHYMQHIAYAKAYFDEKQKGEFSHVYITDVDEFWVPKDFKTTLPSFIEDLPPHSSVSFQWFNIIGDEEKFSPVRSTMTGEKFPHTKSAINLESTVDQIRVHLSKFKENKKFKGCILPDGTPFMSRNEKQNEAIDPSLIHKDQDAMILHRIQRSQEEYLSLLHNSTSFLKENRQGFIADSPRKTTVSFPEEAFTFYEKEKKAFFEKVDLNTEMQKARNFVLERLNKTIETLENAPTEKEEVIKKIFRGVTHEQTLKALENYYKRVHADK